MKVSIKDISKITRFSVTTISNALNHKTNVNKDTAEEIFRVAREIGYLNASTVKKIKLVIYKKDGSIIEDTPFFPALINGFEQECRESGYEMVVGNLDKRQEDYEEQAKLILEDPDTAVVLLGTELSDADMDLYHNAKIPILLLDYWCSDMTFSGVMINNSDSVRLVINYLIKKGHKQIGYLKGKFRILGFRQRQSGFSSALREHNMELDPKFVVELSTTMNGAYKDMMSYLDNKQPLPTAFFADNDMIALGAMKALQECGYNIPDDISIIGFDDLPFCEITSPRLTSIRVPKQEMGIIAARRIIEMIRTDSDIHTKTQVCTYFIERESVKSLEK